MSAAKDKGPTLQDCELETQILGAVLHEPMLIRDSQHIEPDAFDTKSHQVIWAAMGRLYVHSHTINIQTLANELGDNLDKVGGRDYLSHLHLSGDMMVQAFPEALERLRELWVWRSISKTASEAMHVIREQDIKPDDAASRLIRSLESIIGKGAAEMRTKRDVAQQAISDALEDDLSTPTGIYELDLLMHGGPKPRRLYGIGGLYGRGKTILLGTISDNLNYAGVSHAFISLETPPEDIEVRNIARALEINASDIYDRDSGLHQRFIENTQLYLDELENNTFFLHKPGSSWDEIERLILQLVHKHGIRGFILDYWQLLKGREKGQSEDNFLRECADRMAALCRREGIWAIVACQLDEYGEVAYCPRGMKTAASLFISIKRDPNDDQASLVTEKSNYTPYANIGLNGGSGLVFDRAGPHFRSALDSDPMAPGPGE